MQTVTAKCDQCKTEGLCIQLDYRLSVAWYCFDCLRAALALLEGQQGESLPEVKLKAFPKDFHIAVDPAAPNYIGVFQLPASAIVSTMTQEAADFEQKCYKLASIAPIAYDDLRTLITKTTMRSGTWQTVYDDFYRRACQGDFSWIEES